MNLKSIATAGLALLLLAVSTPGYCWDEYAHMVICQIAYAKLTPKTKAAVGDLVTELNKNPDVTGLASDVQPYNAVTVGAWMDDMKSIDRQYNELHFIDLPFQSNTTAADVKVFDSASGTPANAYGTIERQCLPILKNPAAAPADRAKMLGFLMHLVGDIHQPLHAVARDRGGNDYKIDPMPAFDPTWRIMNLHAFWDNAYRYDVVGGKITVVVADLGHPRPSSLDSGSVHDFAVALDRQYGQSLVKQIAVSDPAEWVAESARIACSDAFPAGGMHTLTPDYVHMAHIIACQRLVLAGCRLANLLDSLFDK